MKIAFDQLPETRLDAFYGGEKALCAGIHQDENGKILRGKLVPGASIGVHTHATSSEMIYILSGTGKSLYDGVWERLAAGDCHYCPKGHSHNLVNDGDADLCFFAVVPEQ